MRRHLATKNDKKIYSSKRNSNNYLALDYHRKRLYAFEGWGIGNVIIKMDYDGRNRNHTADNGSLSGRLSVDIIKNFLYWKGRNSPLIIKMNISSGYISRYIPLPEGSTRAKLLVVDQNRQPKGKFNTPVR